MFKYKEKMALTYNIHGKKFSMNHNVNCLEFR